MNDLEKIISRLEWAYNTIDSKLTFGLPEEIAIGRREIRVKGVLMESIKKLKGDGVSEDEIKVGEGEVQKLTDSFIAKVDQLAELKEKDIMTV